MPMKCFPVSISLCACLLNLISFLPTWITRPIFKQKVGLAPRDMNGPRAGNWVTLAMMKKYVIYQCFLWKDLPLLIKGGNDKGTLHVLRYGKVILVYIWFNLKFRLTKQPPGSLLNTHCNTVNQKLKNNSKQHSHTYIIHTYIVHLL